MVRRRRACSCRRPRRQGVLHHVAGNSSRWRRPPPPVPPRLIVRPDGSDFTSLPFSLWTAVAVVREEEQGRPATSLSPSMLLRYPPRGGSLPSPRSIVDAMAKRSADAQGWWRVRLGDRIRGAEDGDDHVDHRTGSDSSGCQTAQRQKLPFHFQQHRRLLLSKIKDCHAMENLPLDGFLLEQHGLHQLEPGGMAWMISIYGQYKQKEHQWHLQQSGSDMYTDALQRSLMEGISEL